MARQTTLGGGYMAEEKKVRYDVLTAREYQQGGDTKVAWTRIGVGWPANDGEGMTIYLSALPLTDPKTGTANLYCKLHKEDERSE